MDRRNFLIAGGAVAAAAALPAGALRAAALGRGEVREDVEVARRALALHPGLHRYLTSAQVERNLARLATDMAAAGDRAGQFLAVQKLASSVRCGHTHCNFYNQTDQVVAELFDRPTRLPFAFHWIGDRMIVVAAPTYDPALPPGTEITSLNGRPPRDLLVALMPYTRADGHNDAKRRVQLEMRNTDKFEYFDIFQGLMFPPPGGVHRIEARRPDGGRVRIERQAIDMTQRRATMRVADTERDGPLWQWEMRGDVALMTMPSWVTYHTKWDWQGWLNDRLDSLAGSGARGLVIDLRDNEGGTDCGNAILSRLTGRDLELSGYRRLVRFRQTPADLDPYLDTWDRTFRTMGADARDVGGGFYQLPGENEAFDRVSASGPRITVPAAALISPVCSSATYAFARRAKESGLVRLFGETSGGNLRGINGGAYFFVRLPHSGVEFDLPIVGYFPQRPRPDAGVEPDVRVDRTAVDIASGRDRCLETALGWIGAGPAS